MVQRHANIACNRCLPEKCFSANGIDEALRFFAFESEYFRNAEKPVRGINGDGRTNELRSKAVSECRRSNIRKLISRNGGTSNVRASWAAYTTLERYRVRRHEVLTKA